MFKNVGLTKTAQVKGLDLSGLDACYITVRAWKIDEDCTELSIKAHTLKGRESVYCQLVVGDGFVTVTEGESIRKFFKRADEVVKEVTRVYKACYISSFCIKFNLASIFSVA